MKKTLLIMSGLSAVGKRPLVDALARRVTMEEALGVPVEAPTRMQEYLRKDKKSTILPNDISALKQVFV